jgi:hypothetical protein
MLGVLGCALGVGNLTYVQHQDQVCLHKYMTYDSAAKKARAKASNIQSTALVLAFQSITTVIQPGHKATKKEISDLIKNIGAVAPAATANDAAVKAHPYYDFKDVCG